MAQPSQKRKRYSPTSNMSSEESSMDDILNYTPQDSQTTQEYESAQEDIKIEHEEEEDIEAPTNNQYYDNFFPDEHEQDTYCIACREAFGAKKFYLTHMWDVHKLVCCQIRSPVFHTHITPDVNDPSLYCDACEIGFRYAKAFRNHMRNIHNLKPPAPIKPHLFDPQLIAELSHTYCRTCEKKFESVYDFRYHIENVHKMTKFPTLVNRDDWPPKLI